jgi:hypothetical protein
MWLPSSQVQLSFTGEEVKRMYSIKSFVVLEYSKQILDSLPFPDSYLMDSRKPSQDSESGGVSLQPRNIQFPKGFTNLK